MGTIQPATYISSTEQDWEIEERFLELKAHGMVVDDLDLMVRELEPRPVRRPLLATFRQAAQPLGPLGC